MEPLTITAAVTVLTALLSTIIAAIAIQAHWTASQKRIVSGIVAIVLATLAAIGTNQIDGLPPEWVAFVAKWVGMAGAVAFLAQGAYTQFKGILDKLTAATTLTPAPTVDDGQDGTTEGTAGLPDTSSSDASTSTEDA